MKFTDEQLGLILIQMKYCIEESEEIIAEFGYFDEVTAGCDDEIRVARSVIDTILTCK